MTDAKKVFFLSFLLLFGLSRTALATNSSISFSENAISLAEGSQKKVDVVLDPGGAEVIGIDLFIKYDPKYVKVIEVEDLKAFSTSPAQSVDNDSGSVEIAFSNDYSVFTTEKKSVAKITFEGRERTESTNVSFDFSPGSSTDSNVVVSEGVDILIRTGSLLVKVESPASELTPGVSVTPDNASDKDTPSKLNPFRKKEGIVKGAEDSLTIKSDDNDSKLSGNSYIYFLVVFGLLISGGLSGYFIGRIGRKRRI